MDKKLWTKDYALMTVGTAISMLGNAMSGFAIGLLVLDYTQSVFLYALFIVGYNLPKVIMPIVAGPYIDRLSRKKILYSLDFFSAGIFLLIGVIINYEVFNYLLFLSVTMLIGTIDGIYRVAYDSLYPTLVDKENYHKAYSISSVISPLSTVMIPVAAILYETIGLAPIFFTDAVSFLIAALCETQIKGGDFHIEQTEESVNFNRYRKQFGEGLNYIKTERGLWLITMYFAINAFAFGTTLTIALPYFKSNPNLGVVNYTFVMAFNIIGRIVSGLLHYKFAYPRHYRFTIFIVACSVIAIVESLYLFTPMGFMILFCFISGFLSIAAFNIRSSSLQIYIPDKIRGRFNGTFQMINTLGSVVGSLLSGAMADLVPYRVVIVVFMGINLIGLWLLVSRNERKIKPIFNYEFLIKSQENNPTLR